MAVSGTDSRGNRGPGGRHAGRDAGRAAKDDGVLDDLEDWLQFPAGLAQAIGRVAAVAMPPPTTRLAARLEQAQAAAVRAGLDALVVSGLANLAYLTGFHMSAGLLVTDH